MKNITTVFLDIDDTLIDFKKSAVEAIEKAHKQFSLPFDKDIIPVFFEENDKLWKLIEKKEIGMKELHERRWNIIFKRVGCNFDGVLFEEAFFDNLQYSAIEVDGAQELLEYLSPKYTLCAASNVPVAERQNRRLEILGFKKHFTHFFYSCTIGSPKPSAQFFAKAFEEMGGVSKENVIFIGDSLSADITGAENFGIKSIWFNINSLPPADVHPSFTVTSLKEIKDIL